MKRKLVKLASVFIVVAVVFCMTAFAVDTSAVGVSSKLSAEVQSKLEVLSDSEKINVYLYFKDSSEAVMATMATTHADLYATYTAAVESSNIPLTATHLTANSNQRSITAQEIELQTAIEVKRSLYRSHYVSANNTILEKYCTNEDIIFVSSYAPMAIVSISPKELKQILYDASIEYVALFENIVSTNSSLTNANMNSRADYVRDTLGNDGYGVKIGQVELAVPNTSHADLASSNIITNTYLGGSYTSINTQHATNVARIMVGTNGVAPAATLYSVGASTILEHYNAIDWLTSQGVNVINMSANFYTNYTYDDFCKYVDHLAVEHDTHFVVSAGNIKERVDESHYVCSPGMAYNAITVGAYNDNNTATADDSQIYTKQKDDYLENYSKYREFETYDRPCKPNLVATGNVFTDGTDLGGTSYAAPQVTGVIAQLCSYNTSLKTKQTCMGAILAASCGRKIASEVQAGTEIITSGFFKGGDFINSVSEAYSDNQISNTQGVGKLDAYWARSIVANGNYWSVTIPDGTTTYSKSVYITKGSTTLTRIAIYWLKRNSADSQNNISTLQMADWRFTVYGPDGTEVASSNTFNSNFEVVQFSPTSSGTYRIEMYRASIDNLKSYIGIAVW